MRISACLLAAMLGCGSEGGNDAVDASPIDAVPTADGNLNLLSQSGLYQDFGSRTIAPDLIEFAPTYILWSDGLLKRRWIRLPGPIDSSDMNHWTFPVGTQLWKEFRTPAKIFETRLIERVGNTEYKMGAYVWDDAQTEAVWTTTGAVDVIGTDHDVPSSSDCLNCHRGEPGRILGVQALQLDSSYYSQVTFTTQPRAGGYHPSWNDPATTAVIGYLHANCGNCHNPNGSAWSATMMPLRLDIADVDADLAQTTVYTQIVGINTDRYMNQPGDFCRLPDVKWKRIAPNDLACSAIYARMGFRGVGSGQMPPLATEHPDTQVVDAVAAWIGSL